MGKGNIFSGKPVFSQIINLKDKSEINGIATEQHANRYTKRLDTYTHFMGHYGNATRCFCRTAAL